MKRREADKAKAKQAARFANWLIIDQMLNSNLVGRLVNWKLHPDDKAWIRKYSGKKYWNLVLRKQSVKALNSPVQSKGNERKPRSYLMK